MTRPTSVRIAESTQSATQTPTTSAEALDHPSVDAFLREVGRWAADAVLAELVAASEQSEQPVNDIAFDLE
jgi:hypothetical protein